MTLRDCCADDFRFIIRITDDFDPRKIVESGQCFRAVCLSEDTFRFITGGNVLYMRSLGDGRYAVSCDEETWNAVWTRYFDLGRDYRAIRETVSKGDCFMAAAAEAGRGIRVLRQEPFETLVSFIISQRKSIPAIQKAVGQLCARFGEKVQTPFETISFFPTAEALAAATEEELASCGLGYRVPYVSDAAWRVMDGQLDLEVLDGLDDLRLIETLKTVHGVGEKVARCAALFAYGRTAAVPVDTWISKIIESRYNGCDPFARRGENAGILQQYAFYYATHHKREL